MGKHERRKPGFWWFVLVAFLNELGLVFLFLPAAAVQEVSAREERLVASELGQEAVEYVVAESGRKFKRLLLDTGIIEASFTFCGYRGQDRFDDRGLGRWFFQRLQVMWMVVRQMFFRWEVMALWLPGAAIFTVPLLVDGMVQREIRKYQFSFASPLVHRKTRLLLHFLLAAAVLLPLLPLSVPPLAYPAALGCAGMALWVMVLSIQKRI